MSTGFRAPTPGQQNAFNVTTAFIGGELTNNGVVPSTSAVAMARGGGQLQPREVAQLQRGRGLHAGRLQPHGRLLPHRRQRPGRPLSQEIALTEPEILTLLAEGIPEARNFPVFRFFLNDFSTTTQGFDLIGTLTAGRTTFNAIYNYTDTELKNIESAVIDEFRINTLERGLPQHPLELQRRPTARTAGSLLGRVSYFARVLGQRGRPERGRAGGRSDGGVDVPPPTRARRCSTSSSGFRSTAASAWPSGPRTS